MKWAVMMLLLAMPGCNCQPGSGPDGGGGGKGGGGGSGGGAAVTGRCDTDLERFKTGTGTLKLVPITDSTQLIGGPTAYGKLGDYLFQNEKIRVIVQGFDRHIGAQPFGGTILDADFVRPAGEPGQDQFGELGLLYNFGRTLDPDKFEILSDGSDGRSVVLAVTGLDAANDYLSIRNQLRNMVGQLPVTDPYEPVTLKMTSYFILNPNEQRLRFVTAFCNTSPVKEVVLAVGDLTDPGYVLELFNPQACTAGFGSGGLCFGLDRMNWFGYQGNGIAYGYSPYKAGSPLQPEPQNAVLTVAGITGTIIGAAGLNGLLTWFDASKSSWQGELRLPGGGNGVFARDFVIGRDLGELNNLIEGERAKVTQDLPGEVEATVTSNGAALANARVTFQSNNGNVVLITGADGKAKGLLSPRLWTAAAWTPGRNPSMPKPVTISATAPAAVAFDLVTPRTLTVNVREANGGAMPGRVTVLCASGPCPAPQRTLVAFADVHKDPMPDNVQAVGFVGVTGTLTLQLPPAQYLVLVSRGPEYSIHPNGYPSTPGTSVDLRNANGTVNAVLARVIDTTNAMEILNNADDEFDAQGLAARGRMNDWMTLLSRGLPIVATGTSDTHYRAMTTGWRSFVEMGVDAPAQFDPMLMSTRLNAMRAMVTNGPFAKISVYRVDAAGTQVTPSTGPGGTVVQDVRDLGVSLDIQVPEYLDVTRVELYLHKTQDDLACPIDPLSAKAATTRVACDGVTNSNWPASGISATQAVALNASDLQTVTTDSGVTYRRYRKGVTFRVPAPTTDNWVVAMIYGSRTLFPLNFNPPGSSGASQPTAPFALTNPVFIDANGGGYDKPPFKTSGSTRRVALPEPEIVPPGSVEEMLQRWGAFVGTH